MGKHKRQLNQEHQDLVHGMRSLYTKMKECYTLHSKTMKQDLARNPQDLYTKMKEVYTSYHKVVKIVDRIAIQYMNSERSTDNGGANAK